METPQNRDYSDIPVGLAIRRSIAQARTFRIRRGNGYFGSIAGKIYQDQYTYFVPTSITNAAGQTARDAFAAAVTNWQGFSQATRDNYNAKASRYGLHMSGFNLYIRQYVKANT